MTLPYAPLEFEMRRGQLLYDPALMTYRLDEEPVEHGLWTDELAAEVLGVSQRQIMRYKADGVPVARADDFAIRIGSHPLDIWGASWTIADIGDTVRRTKNCSECGAPFVDRSPKHDRLVCSKRCRTARQVRLKRERAARADLPIGVTPHRHDAPETTTETERTAA